MKRTLMLGLLVLSAFGTPALAGIGKGNGEIGFDLGWTQFDSGVTDELGGRFVFRGGYHITKLFQIEGQGGCSATTDETILFDTDIYLCTWMANGVFNFHSQSGNIVSYVLGGIGVANLDFDNLFTSTSDSGSATQVAGGVRFFFGRNKRAAFRLELSVLTEDTFDETSTHESFVWGFTWRLGDEK
jgi:opacity protein-like surface antigen